MDESIYSSLDDIAICDRLKKQDKGAWKYILEKVVDQEKRSAANNRKRADWNVSLDSLIARLYEEMVGKQKLDAYRGSGSLIGWLRTYMRGYLMQERPDNSREVSLDGTVKGANGEEVSTFVDTLSFRLSEYGGGRSYADEDDLVLQKERWRIARRCFKELWLGNSMQAYVMLLKARFQMSSQEIKERLGVSSAANVDQMFVRAVKRMKEAREKYEN